MHKRYLNHCTIEFTLKPESPLLIKSGKEGADPTKPDMEFVETYYQGKRTIYLPGSSLKGAIRAHSERIVRTIGDETPPENDKQIWANDPINDDYEYLEKVKKDSKAVYKKSSFTDQMFGNTYVASRVRVEDAYPVEGSPIHIEERNGVAIDRVFGSVAVGPFNYQVCTTGDFKAKIHLKNFTLAQLGLIGLVLRDLDEGWFNLGFAKSRGLGGVSVQLDQALVKYPSCVIQDDRMCFFGSEKSWSLTQLLGVGAFLSSGECQKYGFPEQEEEDTQIRGEAMKFDFGVKLTFSGKDAVETLFMHAVNRWKQVVVG
jgi:CRISPR-associated RAMP protein (TIGR02581 family)